MKTETDDLSDILRRQRTERDRVSVLVDREHTARIELIANRSRVKKGAVIRAIISLGLPLLERRLDDEEAQYRAEEFRVQCEVGERVFSDVDLSYAPLSGLDLSDRENPLLLVGADLSNSDLSGTSLSHAVLQNVNLSGANLRGASLRQCDLRGADLWGVNLLRCDVYGARCDINTKWPAGFDFEEAGAVEVDELVIEREVGDHENLPIPLPPPKRE